MNTYLAFPSLYRGIVPASTGTFVGHGVRTLMYEAALKLFMAVGMPELQVCGAFVTGC